MVGQVIRLQMRTALTANAVEELERKVLPILHNIRGFRGLFVVNGLDEVVMVSYWVHLGDLERSDTLLLRWIHETLAGQLVREPQETVGEIAVASTGRRI